MWQTGGLLHNLAPCCTVSRKDSGDQTLRTRRNQKGEPPSPASSSCFSPSSSSKKRSRTPMRRADAGLADRTPVLLPHSFQAQEHAGLAGRKLGFRCPLITSSSCCISTFVSHRCHVGVRGHCVINVDPVNPYDSAQLRRSIPRFVCSSTRCKAERSARSISISLSTSARSSRMPAHPLSSFCPASSLWKSFTSSSQASGMISGAGRHGRSLWNNRFLRAPFAVSSGSHTMSEIPSAGRMYWVTLAAHAPCQPHRAPSSWASRLTLSAHSRGHSLGQHLRPSGW